jgi:5-(carboxyamino)imidazole ribonucleotide mutase
MNPQVGIIMGSQSDLPVMAEAAQFLEEIGIEYELWFQRIGRLSG